MNIINLNKSHKTYISILRGINVGGHKTIRMDALKKMYQDLQFKNIQTYIQSGNVIFQTKGSEPKDLETIISNQIQRDFGFDVPVIVLSVEELRTIIQNNPYIADETKDDSYLAVTFLKAKPETIDFESIKQKQTQGEEINIINKAIYLYCPNGFAKTKITHTFLEKKLKVIATTRNWKTTNKLISMAEEIKI